MTRSILESLMGEDRVLELNDRLEFEIVTEHSAKARIYKMVLVSRRTADYSLLYH